MPLTPALSEQYVNLNTPGKLVQSSDWNSKMRVSYGKMTFTAAGTGTAKLIKMPAGKVRIFSDLSRVICPVGTATADLHVGHAAYTKRDGTAGAAVDNAFADNLDVGGGAIDAAFSLPASGIYEVESQDGFDIEAMIDTANSPAAGDLLVWVVYEQGN